MNILQSIFNFLFPNSPKFSDFDPKSNLTAISPDFTELSDTTYLLGYADDINNKLVHFWEKSGPYCDPSLRLGRVVTRTELVSKSRFPCQKCNKICIERMHVTTASPASDAEEVTELALHHALALVNNNNASTSTGASPLEATQGRNRRNSPVSPKELVRIQTLILQTLQSSGTPLTIVTIKQQANLTSVRNSPIKSALRKLSQQRLIQTVGSKNKYALYQYTGNVPTDKDLSSALNHFAKIPK